MYADNDEGDEMPLRRMIYKIESERKNDNDETEDDNDEEENIHVCMDVVYRNQLDWQEQ